MIVENKMTIPGQIRRIILEPHKIIVSEYGGKETIFTKGSTKDVKK